MGADQKGVRVFGNALTANITQRNQSGGRNRVCCDHPATGAQPTPCTHPTAGLQPSASVDPATAPPQVQKLPPYHVILLDDDDHTYEYVIEMLGRLFHIEREKAYRMASEVDMTGRVIVYTGPLEQAELKQDQIHSYGRDPRLERSVGSMSAIIEPAT